MANKTTLRQKDIYKLARILRIEPEKVFNMVSMGVLDTDRASEVLIKFDFKNLNRNFRTNMRLAKQVIESDYHVSRNKVNKSCRSADKIVKADLVCKKCGRPITRHEKKTYDQMCLQCAMESSLSEGGAF